MIGVLILTLIAFLLSLIITFIDYKTKNKYIDYLPGLNCGSCGYGSCEEMSNEINKNFKCYKKCRLLKGEKLEKFLKECDRDA